MTSEVMSFDENIRCVRDGYTHDIRRAAATHLQLAGMPLKRLQDILGNNSLEVTQLNILEDESEINGSHIPFDLLDGID